jgi:hypothetical protein
MGKRSDRRGTPRIAVFDTFHILNAQNGDTVGYLRDISSNGMMVMGESAPDLDRPMKLAIVLPEPIEGVNILQIQASCRWHTFDALRAFHKSGFQFGELGELERRIVEQIQEDYEFSTTEGEP